ncbi:MAG: mechanosensitive ion channel [Rikenellaceae bacterium]|nr:mechanosensitive ion channel [Rikenellaceae bacterium]
MKEHIMQIIASAVVVALLPLSKLIVNKLIRPNGVGAQRSEARTLQVRHIIVVILNVTFLFALAIIWGVEPQNMLLGLSSIVAVLGVALFAQWSVLSNITAGIVMFFTAPFRIGDRIRILDKDVPLNATIENIQTFYTHLRTDEGELIVLPNNLFLQKIVSVKKEG